MTIYLIAFYAVWQTISYENQTLSLNHTSFPAKSICLINIMPILPDNLA